MDWWITCGLLWCFYQLFGLSFWRHPFTAEHPLLSEWCNATFLQIWWRNKLIYISDGLRMSTFQQILICGWTIPVTQTVYEKSCYNKKEALFLSLDAIHPMSQSWMLKVLHLQVQFQCELYHIFNIPRLMNQSQGYSFGCFSSSDFSLINLEKPRSHLD